MILRRSLVDDVTTDDDDNDDDETAAGAIETSVSQQSRDADESRHNWLRVTSID